VSEEAAMFYELRNRGTSRFPSARLQLRQQNIHSPQWQRARPHLATAKRQPYPAVAVLRPNRSGWSFARASLVKQMRGLKLIGRIGIILPAIGVESVADGACWTG